MKNKKKKSNLKRITGGKKQIKKKLMKQIKIGPLKKGELLLVEAGDPKNNIFFTEEQINEIMENLSKCIFQSNKPAILIVPPYIKFKKIIKIDENNFDIKTIEKQKIKKEKSKIISKKAKKPKKKKNRRVQSN